MKIYASRCAPPLLRIIVDMSGSFPYAMILTLFIVSMLEGLSVISLLSALIVIYEPGSLDDSPVVRQLFGLLTLEEQEKPSISLVFAFVALFLCIKGAASFLVGMHLRVKAEEIANRLRAELISAMMRARWSYFNATGSGGVMAGVNNEAIRASLAYRLTLLYAAGLMRFFVYFVVSFLISPQLALVGFSFCLIAFFLLRFLVKMSRRAGGAQTQRTVELVSMLEHTLDAIKSVKAMAREKYFGAFMNDRIDRLNKAAGSMAMAHSGREQGEILLFSMAILVIVYILSVVLLSPLTHMVTMAFVLFRFFTNYNSMQNYRQEIAEYEKAYWSLRERIALAENHRESDDGDLPSSLTSECRLKNVSFGYGDDLVLKEVDIELPAHRLTVLIGPSGSGKTTVADLLSGLLKPQRGSVEIDGVPLSAISQSAWRSGIGYVDQDTALFEGTVRANLLLGASDIDDQALWKALAAADIAELIRNFPDRLETRIGEKGRTLSGGQKQRISLARALLNNPDLLILDEVTSALDPESERAICRNIRDLSRNYTILSITHKPIWLEAADRIYYIENGSARRIEDASDRSFATYGYSGGFDGKNKDLPPNPDHQSQPYEKQ